MKLNTCKCTWCDTEYQTSQPQRRKFCGNASCYKQFHKSRQKEFLLTNKEMFRLIDDWMQQSPPRHPNPLHPVMLADKVFADMCRAASEALKLEIEYQSVIEAYGSPENASKSLAEVIEQLKNQQ